MTEIYGESGEPRFLTEHAARSAIEAAKKVAEDAGFQLDQMVVMLTIDGAKPVSSCTAGHGIGDGQDLIVEAMHHLSFACQQIGMELHIFPMGRPNQG